MEFNIKDDKLVFTYESKEYFIPGELYPLTSANSEDMVLTTVDDVSEIQDARLLRILNTLQIEMGRCYENSERIYQALKAKEYDVHFLSGWIFTGNEPPVHHAWVLVKVQGKLHLIDSTYNKVLSTVKKKLNIQPDEGLDEVRKTFVKIYQKELKKSKRNTDRITTGKPPNGFVYLGVESSFEETMSIYRELIKIENHPSYRGGMKLGGDSVMQEQLKGQIDTPHS